MIKLNLKIASALLIMSTSASLHAGTTQPFPVTLDTEAKTAQGDMVTARFSENEFSNIGCGTRYATNEEGDVAVFGFCQARVGETEEESVRCFTQEPLLIEAINSIASFSFISFRWEEIPEDSNKCVDIGVSTQSFYIPEFKDDLTDLENGLSELQNRTQKIKK